MNIIKFLKAVFDTIDDFRTFRKRAKEHFHRPPSLRDYVNETFDAQEAAEQEKYAREVQGKVAADLLSKDQQLCELLFPDEGAVRRFLSAEGQPLPKQITKWSVAFSQKYMALRLFVYTDGSVLYPMGVNVFGSEPKLPTGNAIVVKNISDQEMAALKSDAIKAGFKPTEPQP